MRIGLDFDEVVVDTSRLFSVIAADLYNVVVPPEKFYLDAVVQEHLLTAGQYDAVWERVFYSDRGLELQPIPGAMDFLPGLIQDHDVSIVTSRGRDSAAIALKWLSTHAVNIPVSFTCDRSKASYCRGLDVFVDDNLVRLFELQSVVAVRLHFCYYDISSHPLIEKVESWQELYEKIVCLSSE